MQIEDLIWLDEIVEKLESKHQVSIGEVEQIFEGRHHFRYISKGRHHRNENVYAAYGQTEAGRYLSVFFYLQTWSPRPDH